MTAAGALSRGLAVLEALAGSKDGLPLKQVAEALDLPKSAAHRILANLAQEGYVRQDERSGSYTLTFRLVGLGLRHLASSTIADLATPTLQRLAAESGQLVRLALADQERLIWVARCQGARSGLRYDSDIDHGEEVPLDSSATGLAWLSALPFDVALRRVVQQQVPLRHQPGPEVPHSLEDVTRRIQEAQSKGWAEVHNANEAGVAAMAVPVLERDSGKALGSLSIAGPSVILDEKRMQELVLPLKEAVEELSDLATAMAGELRHASEAA